MAKINSCFTDFKQRLVAISGLIKKHKIEKKVNKICIIIIHQINTTKYPKIIYTKELNNVDTKQL